VGELRLGVSRIWSRAFPAAWAARNAASLEM
jgi:hypothetical protein